MKIERTNNKVRYTVFIEESRWPIWPEEEMRKLVEDRLTAKQERKLDTNKSGRKHAKDRVKLVKIAMCVASLICVDVSRRVRTNKNTVKWLGMCFFEKQKLSDYGKERSYSGNNSINTSCAVVQLTVHLMVNDFGQSNNFVHVLWRKEGSNLHQFCSIILKWVPSFVDEMRDVVGLYTNTFVRNFSSDLPSTYTRSTFDGSIRMEWDFVDQKIGFPIILKTHDREWVCYRSSEDDQKHAREILLESSEDWNWIEKEIKTLEDHITLIMNY